ncbi:MAG: ATP-binding protein [Cyanobacteria bacterium P01_D01_bin.156]
MSPSLSSHPEASDSAAISLEQQVEKLTQQLFETRQLLDQLTNSLPQSIFWKDRNSVYLGCNQSFAKAAGMSVEEVVGKTDYDMPWVEGEAPICEAGDRRVMDANAPDLGVVEHQQLADGNEIWIETSKAPFHDTSGNVAGLVGILQDITPYKEAESAANQASQAKSEFLANMSHELRTPLNGILGYAQILGRSQTLSKKEREGVNVIHQCGSHLLTLINDILDLSKIEARKLELMPKALHLPSLLQSVVEMCRIRAEQKGLDFIYQPSSRLPNGIQADEKRLRQVLINLLGNAIKFTAHGSITLRVDVLRDSNTQASLLFQVIDTGIGIAESDISQLFQAFEQVGDRKKQSEGTGLGLAISQRIIHLMGGEIQVKSQLNQGSEFYFSVDLPIENDWAIQQVNRAENEHIIGYKGETLKILVVDDRWENRAVVKNLLEPLQFNVIEAKNGQEGLKKLLADSPDLVITDLAMPVMDGFEFLQHVRSADALHQSKVIVSSASVSLEDQQLSLEKGGDAFLSKPVDVGELLDILETHLELDWIFNDVEDSAESSKTTPVEVVLPSSASLEALLNAAQQADLKSVQEQLDALVTQDIKYTSFAAPILQLAEQFQVEEIEDLLQASLRELLVNG